MNFINKYLAVFSLLITITTLGNQSNYLLRYSTKAKGHLELSAENPSKLLCEEKIYKQLTAKIISNPKLLLQEHVAYISQLNTIAMNQPDAIQYSKYADKSATNPCFFLGECSDEFCGLNRTHTTKRQDFSDKVVDLILKNRPNKNDELIFISFASAKFFTETIILTKLIAAGYTNIKIHLIDINYQEYIEIINKNNSHILPDIVDSHKARQAWLRATTYSFDQLIRYLNWLSNNTISIHIYDSADTYLQMLDKKQAPLADLIMGVDYAEFYSMQPKRIINAVGDFFKLSFTATKINGFICSLLDIPNPKASKYFLKKINKLPVNLAQVLKKNNQSIIDVINPALAKLFLEKTKKTSPISLSETFLEVQ